MNPDNAGGQRPAHERSAQEYSVQEHSARETSRDDRRTPDAPPGTYPGASLGMTDPQILLTNLTRCIIEVLAGARDLEQLGRWVSEDVYRHLLTRTVLSDRARRITQRRLARPIFSVGNIHMFEPRPGVVEAVVMVHNRIRARSVAIRLEAMHDRWRASAIHVL